jgi:hypothetical protein
MLEQIQNARIGNMRHVKIEGAERHKQPALTRLERPGNGEHRVQPNGGRPIEGPEFEVVQNPGKMARQGSAALDRFPGQQPGFAVRRQSRDDVQPGPLAPPQDRVACRCLGQGAKPSEDRAQALPDHPAAACV